MKTKILCLEGITGGGKTIQSRNIDSYLKLQDKKPLIINEKEYEPFKTVIIEWHKAGANQNFSVTDIEKIANARAEIHKNYFIPLLNKLDYLIFDRCFYTSAVYQTDGELNLKEIIQINLEAGAIKPEKGVVLICSPEIALERANIRRKQKRDYLLPSMNETLEEITKRRELYLQLCRGHSNLYVIDTSYKSEEEVFKEIKNSLRL